MGVKILCQAHVPKPLHGMNPRTILGKEWWDKVRKQAQAYNNYCCYACGVHKSQAKKHKWLEGHEIWDINYETGECKIPAIASLCPYCHSFIHSGRLKMIMDKGEITVTKAMQILQHGFDLLKGTDNKVFFYTWDLAQELNVNTYNVGFYTVEDACNWEDYVLILKGKKYKSKFKDYEEWINFYNPGILERCSK